MTEFRSGFACLVGRPNTGKSTLTNALVGQKIAITSTRPQTTRRAIRGIMHREDGQIILVDTPGMHRPRTLLGTRLGDLVAETLSEVDVIVFCLPADQPIGPGDRYIAEQLASSRTPVIAVVTKVDTVGRAAVADHLLAVHDLGDWAEIIPVSAQTGEQLDTISNVLLSYLPPGPALYPDGDITDQPEEILVAELIREAALEGVREELPHSLAVEVEEIVPREDRSDGLVDVRVNLFVERSSQKAIVIGTGGTRLRQVGTEARGAIQALLGVPVYLDLHVKVAKEWQKDPKYLQRFGF